VLGKKMNRRYEEPENLYLGLEGLAKAHEDKKIWLNNINLLLNIFTDFILQETRHYAFRIAGSEDFSPAQWPDLTQNNTSPAHLKRWQRLADFIRIFSARDSRFAYDADYSPGGPLERRLLRYMGHSDEILEDEAATMWNYPIDTDHPLDAPAQMRLLNIWINFWELDYYGMATSVLSCSHHQVLAGEPVVLMDPTDDSDYSFGKLWRDEGRLSTFLHRMVCSWVEVFAGLKSLKLVQTLEPLVSEAYAYFTIIDRDPAKVSELIFSPIDVPDKSFWRSVGEIHDQ
jgi:hypothetical protein